MLCYSIEELLKHGPLKPDELRGLKETEDLQPDIEDKYKLPKPKMPEKVGTRYNEDKTSHRTGWILEEDVTNTILKGIMDAKDYINYKRVEEKKSTTLKELFDFIDIMKAGVMIGYPCYHGLPEWEPCRILLEEKDDLINKDDTQQPEVKIQFKFLQFYKFDNTTLWSCGKEYERGKLLSDYIKNEKTKVVCKFAKKGAGAPVREPVIDKETHQKMLSYYFKKQEEQKV